MKIIIGTMLFLIATYVITSVIIYKLRCYESERIKRDQELKVDRETYFNGSTYKLARFFDSYHSEISFQVRSSNGSKGGLLFAIGEPSTAEKPRSKYSVMYATYRGGIYYNRNTVHNGLLVLQYNPESSTVTNVNLMDGKWHDVTLKRSSHSVKLIIDGFKVDEKKMSEETIDETDLYVGGKPFEEANNGFLGYVGYIRNVVLNGLEADLRTIVYVKRQ